MLPALAYLITVPLKMALGGRDPAPEGIQVVQTLRCLSGGFLITGLLWAAALAMLLDGRRLASAAYFALAGIAAFFGIIHSPLADEQIGLPHHILAQVTPAFWKAVRYQTPYHWAGAYALVVLLLLGLSLSRSRQAEEEKKS
jgi:AGZA family xanthine/uracil permease-like MFS transporter